MLAESVNSVRPPGRILKEHRGHMAHEGVWVRVGDGPVVGPCDRLERHLFHDAFPLLFPSGIAWYYKNSSFFSTKEKKYQIKKLATK